MASSWLTLGILMPLGEEKTLRRLFENAQKISKGFSTSSLASSSHAPLGSDNVFPKAFRGHLLHRGPAVLGGGGMDSPNCGCMEQHRGEPILAKKACERGTSSTPLRSLRAKRCTGQVRGGDALSFHPCMPLVGLHYLHHRRQHACRSHEPTAEDMAIWCQLHS